MFSFLSYDYFLEMTYQNMFINERSSFFIQNRDYAKDIINYLTKNEISNSFKIFGNTNDVF